MTPSRRAALIVDDQPFVGMVASDILKESGYETFHAFDANDATAVLREHPEIEIVVTEAKLPGEVNGLELCRQVAAQRPDVQFVVTAENELPAGDIPNGARVLHKPYASGELKTLIAAKSLLDA
jgi:CheY-like chemotaxis protein